MYQYIIIGPEQSTKVFFAKFVLFQNVKVFSLARKFSALIMIPIASALYKCYAFNLIYQNYGAATPYR